MLKTLLHKLGAALLCTALLLPLLPAATLRADDAFPIEKRLILRNNFYDYTTGGWDDEGAVPASLQFFPQTETLRLTNYNGGFIVSYGLDLTIELVGKNTINDPYISCALNCLRGNCDSAASLRIRALTPDASLHIEGGKHYEGIHADGNVVLESGAVRMDKAPKLNTGILAEGAITIGEAAAFSATTTSATNPNPAALSAGRGITTAGKRWLREGSSPATLRTVAQLGLAYVSQPQYGNPGFIIPATAACVKVEPAYTLDGLSARDLPAAGGKAEVSLTGANLPEGIRFTAFENGQETGITAQSGQSGGKASATLAFPANTTPTAKAYEIRARLPGEQDYRATPAATVTVAPAASGSAPAGTPAESLSLNMSAKLLRPGKRAALQATAAGAGTVTWQSSDPKVATVSSSGVVKALKSGRVTITAASGGTTANCRIIVRADAAKKSVKSIKLNVRSAILRRGKSVALAATLTPKEPLYKKLTWTSSNPAVATVNAKGVVTAKGKGTAKITATSYEGGRKATCTVKVK